VTSNIVPVHAIREWESLKSFLTTALGRGGRSVLPPAASLYPLNRRARLSQS